MRRALVLAVSAALACAGSAPALAKARPKKPKLPKCVSFTDAKGDAGPVNPAVTGDPGLDITKVTVSATATHLVARFAVDGLAENPTKALGDRFAFHFAYGDRQVQAYYMRSRTRDVEQNVFYQAGIYVDDVHVEGSNASVTGVHDLATKTMTLSVKISGLRAAVGRGIDRGEIDHLRGVASGAFAGTSTMWDQATPADPFLPFKVGPCAP